MVDLRGLNHAQLEAVTTTEGPILVLAGAGSGKTRVITYRLAHLLGKGVRPDNVLCVTFTNKAAREMRERVAAQIGLPVEGWWLGTFHALAARMLRRHAELVGLRSDFTILDTDDQIRLVKQVSEAANIDQKKWPARVILSAIERWKDRGLTPDRLEAGDGGDLAGGRMIELYSAYQQRLQTLNACDFGDLLLHTITIMQRNTEVLERYHQRFRYLLVDEYQDTNVAQYLWLRLLAQGHRNICCVGDDDQSIYGWRGAEVGNILRFETDFPGAAVIRLEQNYRSTGNILAAASGLIAHNRGRLGKTLWTADGSGGDPVVVRGVWEGEEEARWVADEIERLQAKEDVRLRDIAILVRAGHQSREFEERFLTVGMPYRVLGGPRFYERQEIRDALAYLRVVAQPDDDLALERIINTPRRGVGPSALQTLHQAARADGVSLHEAALRLGQTDVLKPKMRITIRTLMTDFERWRGMLSTTQHAEVVRTILDESGYTGMWQQDKSPEAPGRLENLKEFVEAVAEFETLPAFLEHVSLVMENQDSSDGDQVTVMTLHGAKGLEFPVVFLPGWEEGLFPNQRAMDETGVAGLEEERRLAYVGLTRARTRAYVSHAANRRVFGNWTSTIPSRFVEELPAPHIREEVDNGVYGGGSGFSGAGYPGRGAGNGNGLFSDWQASAQRAARFAGRTIDASPTRVVERPAQTHAFTVGERVFHQKFGYGTVAFVDDERSMEGVKLEVDFDISGRKRLVDSFVVPADKAGA